MAVVRIETVPTAGKSEYHISASDEDLPSNGDHDWAASA